MGLMRFGICVLAALQKRFHSDNSGNHVEEISATPTRKQYFSPSSARELGLKQLAMTHTETQCSSTIIQKRRRVLHFNEAVPVQETSMKQGPVLLKLNKIQLQVISSVTRTEEENTLYRKFQMQSGICSSQQRRSGFQELGPQLRLQSDLFLREEVYGGLWQQLKDGDAPLFTRQGRGTGSFSSVAKEKEEITLSMSVIHTQLLIPRPEMRSPLLSNIVQRCHDEQVHHMQLAKLVFNKVLANKEKNPTMAAPDASTLQNEQFEVINGKFQQMNLQSHMKHALTAYEIGPQVVSIAQGNIYLKQQLLVAHKAKTKETQELQSLQRERDIFGKKFQNHNYVRQFQKHMQKTQIGRLHQREALQITHILSKYGNRDACKFLEAQTGKLPQECLSIFKEDENTKKGFRAAARFSKFKQSNKTIADLETGNNSEAAKASAEIISVMALLKDVYAVKEQVLGQMYVLKMDARKLQDFLLKRLPDSMGKLQETKMELFLESQIQACEVQILWAPIKHITTKQQKMNQTLDDEYPKAIEEIFDVRPRLEDILNENIHLNSEKSPLNMELYEHKQTAGQLQDERKAIEDEMHQQVNEEESLKDKSEKTEGLKIVTNTHPSKEYICTLKEHDLDHMKILKMDTHEFQDYMHQDLNLSNFQHKIRLPLPNFHVGRKEHRLQKQTQKVTMLKSHVGRSHQDEALQFMHRDNVLSEDGKNNPCKLHATEIKELEQELLSISKEHEKTIQGTEAAARFAKVKQPKTAIADSESWDNNATVKASAEIFSLMALLKGDVHAMKVVFGEMYALKMDTLKLKDYLLKWLPDSMGKLQATNMEQSLEACEVQKLQAPIKHIATKQQPMNQTPDDEYLKAIEEVFDVRPRLEVILDENIHLDSEKNRLNMELYPHKEQGSRLQEEKRDIEHELYLQAKVVESLKKKPKKTKDLEIVSHTDQDLDHMKVLKIAARGFQDYMQQELTLFWVQQHKILEEEEGSKIRVPLPAFRVGKKEHRSKKRACCACIFL